MRLECPYCNAESAASETRFRTVRIGRFRRKSDCKYIQRFRCRACGRSFSSATSNIRRGQKKRNKNHLIRDLCCGGMTQRRIARTLNINRKTVARRLRSLAVEARLKLGRDGAVAHHIQFDDMETFEHTKLKPLSITLAVEHPTRRILGFEVSQMPAKGPLARKSRAKYGPRRDERKRGRDRLFQKLRRIVAPDATIESDMNPHYPVSVRAHFPSARYRLHKGQRGSVVGQGELKKIRFDPLFSLNHTCAMKRHSIPRLVRRTWTTTKIPARLEDHLAIYAEFHNSELIK